MSPSKVTASPSKAAARMVVTKNEEEIRRDENNKAKSRSVASDVIGDIIYTCIFDICNLFISDGADVKRALEHGNTLMESFDEKGVKIRKRPAPRKPRATKGTTGTARREKPSMVTTALRKEGVGRGSSKFTWYQHPEHGEYSYTRDIILPHSKGVPLRNNRSGKIIGSITETTTVPIGIEDAKTLLMLGFEVGELE